jgi:hypothetical protein
MFLLRGKWMLRASSRLLQKSVRIVPHIVDTPLLTSAIGLVVWSYQYPGSSSLADRQGDRPNWINRSGQYRAATWVHH